MSAEEDGYIEDQWPCMPDGSKFDGLGLLALVRSGNSPFKQDWDVEQLIAEVEQNLSTKVVDVPMLYNGSNSYGFHSKLDKRPDMLVRMARSDVNMPGFDGFPLDVQVSEVKFEAATYALLRSEPAIRASNLLHHRVPKQYSGDRTSKPHDLSGRRFMVFERANGHNNIFKTLSQENRQTLLADCANIRAALFNYNPPKDFVVGWFRERLFEQKSESFPVPIASTRDFCVGLFTSKIGATIRNIGDMIGWDSDKE